MTPFEHDIADQAAALERVAAYYAGAGLASLDAAARLAADASEVLLIGMGSSLSASMPAAATIGTCLPASVREAGELLHYGMDPIRPGTLAVLVSQSGRSVETVAVAERLRASGQPRIIAVTNDPASPMAAHSDLVLPILAGDEATVATKTWTTTFAVLRLLAGALVGVPASNRRISAATIEALARIVAVPDVADAAAEAMRACVAVTVVGRGPALAAADYGALIVKETAAMPAECLAGGSFRHGPLEIAGPDVGIVVLAPSGLTRELCIGLAHDTAALGSPTWLLVDTTAGVPGTSERLQVTTLPAVEEADTPLTMSVPIQRLAASLARGRGRVPGILVRSQKVTDRE